MLYPSTTRPPRWAGREGQGLAEFVLALPLLLIVVLGILEVGRMTEVGHMLTSLSREGANVASRGASLEEAVALTRANQLASGLGAEGGVIATRLRVDDGLPWVIAQAASEGYEEASRIGSLGSPSIPYEDAGLRDGENYHVVEVLVPYQMATPFHRFVPFDIPAVRYDRALF